MLAPSQTVNVGLSYDTLGGRDEIEKDVCSVND
jgi:hypothetical protein